MISEEALQEFKEIWKEEYGEKISDDFALENAVQLLDCFSIAYRPVKHEWLENIIRESILRFRRYTRKL